MLKICPVCWRTWSGGRDCPQCGPGQPLLDVATRQSRAVFLRDKELASAIRGYYGARSGMLVAFFGILLGLVFALALARKAAIAPGAHAALLWIAAAVCTLVPVAVAIFLADRVVRRFSKGCLGRAPGPGDIRIGRRDDLRKDLLGFGQRG
ncbi:MAG: hypothetical protein NVSMB23_23270 [Myxococcales bacterium]